MDTYQEELVDLAEQALDGAFFNKSSTDHSIIFLVDRITDIRIFLAYFDCKDRNYVCELTAEEQCLFLLFVAEYLENEGEAA